MELIICPICNKGFKTEEIITKHSLQCWREHNPNHQSKSAPCKGNVTKREMNEDVFNFFESFKLGRVPSQSLVAAVNSKRWDARLICWEKAWIMSEIMLKTHLIVTDVHEEYFIKWCGKLADIKPILKNDLPIFIIIGSDGRMELNTIDVKLIERCAKSLSHPRGREAITSDCARIYILDENENEVLMGKVFHNHVKQYQQMYDKFEYI